MIIIETPFHVAFSSFTDHPTSACTAKCKKSWWDRDFENNPTMGLCPMCKGGLSKATAGVHFTVIEHGDRNLTLDDLQRFKGSPATDNLDVGEIGVMLAQGAKIGHLSLVKDKFIERAIKEWSGHEPDISITLVGPDDRQGS